MYSPSLTMSIPQAIWRSTTSVTALGKRSLKACLVLSPPASSSLTSCGRGRLPACETRMRSVLCCKPGSLPQIRFTCLTGLVEDWRPPELGPASGELPFSPIEPVGPTTPPDVGFRSSTRPIIRRPAASASKQEIDGGWADVLWSVADVLPTAHRRTNND